MALLGIDVSYWQLTVPTSVAPDFVIVRATHGMVIDSRCESHYQTAKAAGRLVGVYHITEGKKACAEATHFVEAVQGYLGKAVLALDYESAGNPNWSRGDAIEGEWITTFMETVHELTQVWPVLYVQGSRVSLWHFVKANCALWYAAYPFPRMTTYEQALGHHRPAGALLWQFTSSLGGRSLDRNIFYGDVTTWHNIAAGKNPPFPTIVPAETQDAEPTGVQYTVTSGDTLGKTAAANDTTVAQLAAWNDIQNVNLIYPGQVLRIK
ncbi:MAG: LysM peptidoglycan-binding domain-containing protein [Propionibacteriaceae bacterium]|nr:LysM peptidoglycan-binding domain-containing protein [Propionibacteriaceae bacterium]